MFLLNLKAMAIYYNIYIHAGITQVIQQKEKKYFKYLFFFWTYSLQFKTKPILHKLMILSATWYYLCHYKVLIPPKRISGVLLDLATWGLWTYIRILHLTKYFWKSANRLLPQKTNSFSLLSAVVYRRKLCASLFLFEFKNSSSIYISDMGRYYIHPRTQHPNTFMYG